MAEVTIEKLFSLATHHHQAGRLAEAEGIYRQILSTEPNHAGSLHYLGTIAAKGGNRELAVQLITRSIELRPGDAEAHFNLGCVLKEGRHFPAAVAAFQKAIALRPDDAVLQFRFGLVLMELGQFAAAEAPLRQAIRLNPDLAHGHYQLGNVLIVTGRIEESAEEYRRALQLQPDLVEAHHNLGSALLHKGDLDGAVAEYERAISLRPDYVEAYCNLGYALKEMGQIEGALASDQRAVDLAPNEPAIFSNLLYTLYFDPSASEETILEKHLEWGRRHAEPLKAKWRKHENVRNANRRLRIGYVSPNLREHPVGRFIRPLIAAHDRANFEIFCYAWMRSGDAVTADIQRHADGWRDLAAVSDDEAAEMIRSDRIDVLIDLTMHMVGNRQPIFVRKPAPVQATYLAYVGTTGLEAIDYRLTDAYLDPPGVARLYAERSMYLPRSYWCYEPPTADAGVAPLPADGAGFVTFGCLNNFCKVSAAAIEAWSGILRGVPDSRLLLLAPRGSHRDRLREKFAERGVESLRIGFIENQPMGDYLREYGKIDIALDPFPCAGGTTTCDAMWMGAPVVTLAGKTAMGRGGVSILSNVGMTELIAESADEYVKIAVELAKDRERMRSYRTGLREKMRGSALMDVKGFAREIEQAYRQMWRGWCDQGAG